MTRVSGEPVPLVFWKFLGGRSGRPARKPLNSHAWLVEGEGRRAEPSALDPGNRTERMLWGTSGKGWKNTLPL